MSNIDYNKLLNDMLQEASKILTGYWDETKPYAEKEFKAFLENISLIEKLKLEGKISEERAKLHISMQKNAIRMVLLTIEGLGAIAVENALNAALGIVRDTINTAIGWTLL